MAKRDTLTKILAIAGTVLAWIPILAPFLFSLIILSRGGMFHFDYLMPAELFLVALAGGVLLIWAALRARSRLRLFIWSLSIMVILLVGGQALAVLTGIASGEAEPAGIWMGFILASLAIYVLALAAAGVGGALLLRDLYQAPRAPDRAQAQPRDPGV